jgi:hypothetical protein
MKALTGRSPRKPSLRWDVERLFWHEIAGARTNEDAAVAGQRVATDWESVVPGTWRDAVVHGCPAHRPVSVVPRTAGDRPAEGPGRRVKEIARRSGRDPSTISRGVRRNAATRGWKMDLRASVAVESRAACAASQDGEARRQRTAARVCAGGSFRPGSPPDGTPVPGPVAAAWKWRNKPRRQDRRWASAWSPEQICNRLRLDFPDHDCMCISHEAIDQALVIKGRGALKRELVACLRTGRALRVPRARGPAASRRHGHPRCDDQRTARRTRRPSRAGPLGGRPHHRAGQVRDQHARRANDAPHDGAAPTTDVGLRRRVTGEERPGAGRPRRAGRPRCDRRDNHMLPDELRRTLTWDRSRVHPARQTHGRHPNHQPAIWYRAESASQALRFHSSSPHPP